MKRYALAHVQGVQANERIIQRGARQFCADRTLIRLPSDGVDQGEDYLSAKPLPRRRPALTPREQGVSFPA